MAAAATNDDKNKVLSMKVTKWRAGDQVKMIVMQDPISDRGRQRAPLDWRVLYDTTVT